MTRQYTAPDGDVDSFASVASDAELITAVRGGDDSAFATLWSRHEGAAHRLARQISNPSNADDLVSEAFVRVLHALQGGAGPDGAFRPYLFSTLRRINIDNGRSYYTRVTLTEDERDLDVGQSDSAADIVADDADSSAAWRAWDSLPDSSKTLLWHLIIEEETPAQIAPLIGTTPNGVSSRAVRAKERLRQAFLQQHLLDADNEACRQARRRLGEYVRDALSARDHAEVRRHLEDCDRCRAALFEITDVNRTMKVIIGPIVLGGLTVASYIGAGAAGAAKASILGPFTHIGHALKNPVVAIGTAVATVAVAGVAIAGTYVLTSDNTPAAHPIAGAPTVILASTSAAQIPVPLPSVTPSSGIAAIVATPTPTPTPTAPTPKPTPRKTTASAKKTTTKQVAPIASVAVAAPSTSATTSTGVVPPPPTIVDFYETVPTSNDPITLTLAAAAANPSITFTTSPGWVLYSGKASGSHTCSSVPASTVTCTWPAGLPAGDLVLTDFWFAADVPAGTTEPTGGTFSYSYSDETTSTSTPNVTSAVANSTVPMNLTGNTTPPNP